MRSAARAASTAATTRANATGGISASAEALVTSASPRQRQSAAARQALGPRFTSETPSHVLSAHSAVSMPSGLIDDDMNDSIGHSPTAAAVSVWSARRGPKTSPASSHAAVVVTSSHSTENSRIA